MINLTEKEILDIMCGLKAYINYYEVSGEQKFERIFLFAKLNDYLKKSNQCYFINPYNEFDLNGVELRNYHLWKNNTGHLLRGRLAR
ncbi:hypothetical protein [Sporomusa acidovorans]|uniref:Uncharacterized protein n=1 Tax=Sporomusa acidovorans (strain ATCC 49682 / DSM 3132 / Mol) TaxID=1123286 RepID=A0ABZ3J7D1_SPOA4|nr:hypothetical protein [Sporomusa acidovorans]OZC24178.1 hypothetical protein SPACI_01530 [Sporomusa acidovorans DSM 3132]SDF77888.1 hypothetical protein SAMN04488499_108120 [Sporomusa acidovorans]